MISPALLLLTVATASPALSDVLARVDDVAITSRDVAERRRAIGARSAAVPTSDIVVDLVNDALLAAEARRLGLDRDPAVVAELEAQRRRVVTDALLGKLADGVKPTEAQLKEMFHQTADTVRLKLVKVETKANAEAALKRIQAGGDIESEAAKSLDPTLASRRGDTGPVVRAALPPPIAAKVFDVPTGTIVGPVELDLGWAIAEVVERRIADDAAFAARRDQIASFAREQTMATTKRHLLEKLGGRARVQLDDVFLTSVLGRTDLSQAELDHVIATVNGRPLTYRSVYPTVAKLFGSVAGHGAKGAVTGIVQSEVEAQLLHDEAVARGVDKDPAVTGILPAIERNVLATAMVERVARRDDPQALHRHVTALRAKAKIVVDEKKVAEARR